MGLEVVARVGRGFFSIVTMRGSRGRLFRGNRRNATVDGIRVRTGQLLEKISELASGLKQGSYDSFDIFVLGIFKECI